MNELIKFDIISKNCNKIKEILHEYTELLEVVNLLLFFPVKNFRNNIIINPI